MGDPVVAHAPLVGSVFGIRECPMRQLIILVAVLALNVAVAQEDESKSSEANSEEEQLTIAKIVTERKRGTFREAGSHIDVIDSDKLEKLGFNFVVDAVANTPGVTVNQNGAFGGVAGVRIRGASSSHTLVLVDGVPVNDASTPEGTFDFSRLSSSQIDKIEILRGPHSILWGTNAIGGVIAITTKGPKNGFNADLHGEVGAYNAGRGGVAVGMAQKNRMSRFSLSTISTNGISKADSANGNDEKDSYESTSFSAREVLSLPTGGKLAASINGTYANTEYDSFSATGQGFVGDGKELSKTNELSASLKLEEIDFGENFSSAFSIAISQIERNNFNNGMKSFGAEGKRSLARYQGNLSPNETNTIIFGIEGEQTEVDDNSAVLTSQFVLWEYQPMSNIWVSSGLRNATHDDFGSALVGKLSAYYAVSENLQFNIGWGQGFKIPSIFQSTFSCCGATGPNDDLVPEESEALDLKLDWSSSDRSFSLGVGVFNQDIKNMIRYSRGTYYNLAKVNASGIEISGGYKLKDGGGISANFSVINAEDGKGAKISRIPEYSADVVLSIQPSKHLLGNILIRYNGDERNTDGTTLNEWFRIDFNGQYKVDERSELYVRIENLLNADYQQILGYGTPGFSAYTGFRLRY